MNVVGAIGDYLVQNQEIIGVIGIFAIAFLLIFLVIKLILGDRKKKKLLEEINAKITRVDTMVDKINDKTNREVVYIDSCIRRPVEISRGPSGSIGVDEDAKYESVKESDREKPSADVYSRDDRTYEKEKNREFTKFLDRECGTNKHGESFSLEELEKQIKE